MAIDNLWTPKKSIKKYKSTNTWLNTIYRKNKSFIDSRIEVTDPIESKRDVFKRLVRENIEEGKSPRRSLEIVARSTVFTEVGERLRSNARRGLLKDIENFREFRELTKYGGRYTHINTEAFEWDPETKSYIYQTEVWDKSTKSYVKGNKVRISYKYPKGTTVELIND